MKLKYFAVIRERLNRGEEEVELPTSVRTIDDVITWLCEQDEAAAIILENRKIIITALDDRIVPRHTELGNARTLALLPPMTGG